ncbi:hypothetical protein BGZ76_009139 [Entomortierella beljakovae]|nr:hypothetical protein BGZ76_009139 [Entomortierella beljakovae]
MAYLGYIYGTTNQPTTGNHIPIALSYWHIVSPEASSEFWATVDPREAGGYLEIESPAAIVLMKPSNSTFFDTCGEALDALEEGGCEGQRDWSEALHDDANAKTVAAEGQLDPRRPFKLIWDALVFACLFVLWLIRVFVIPSIILAAAILLLLSYLLSPQRKLLVDLQWGFPFIVLPGDYQSKRKLMMQELMAQEARELGQDPGSSLPLSGAVETLHMGGHKTDIDQMDISFSEGLILTSSIDGTVLLWDGTAGNERGIPLAQLGEGNFTKSEKVIDALKNQARSQKAKSRPAKILKIDPAGDFAIAGFGEGSIHVWELAPILYQSRGYGNDGVIKLDSSLELKRGLEMVTEAPKAKAGAACFRNNAYTKGSLLDKRKLDLLVGYRDGQIWQWSLLTGRGVCIIESKHRGGVAEMMIIELDAKTRLELGIEFKTYLIIAGRDGSIQCWATKNADTLTPEVWELQWSHSGPGNSVSISSLTLDAEVPMAVVGYSNGAIRVWDLEQGNLVWTLSKGTHSVSGSNYSGRLTNTNQPSHQEAITKLCFHALELEDGLTGEPAPRIWLIVSSSSDETVIVWMIEWEGLMGVSSSHDNSVYSGTSSLTPPLMESLPGHLSNLEATERRGMTTGTTRNFNSLSSSLPAPRLVGFMKQRGGKSITVSNSCLYGVRRVEPSTKLVNDRFSSLSRSSVLNSMGASSNFIRRRKTESNSPTLTATLDQMATPTGGAVKRGWELWEADLYQCIFKDPGVWGMDLTVRTINLQPYQEASQSSGPQSFGMDRRPSKHSIAKSVEDNQPGSVANVINTNGSSLALPASPDMRPKLQRKPGSYSHQSPQWGYVYTTSSTNNQSQLQSQGASTAFTDHNQRLYPIQPGRPEIMRGDSQHDVIHGEEDAEPFLLPFVETRLVCALSRRTGSQLRYGSVEQGREQDLKDIVIGFGNFIKIVRLQDEEGDDEDLVNRSGSM